MVLRGMVAKLRGYKSMIASPDFIVACCLFVIAAVSSTLSPSLHDSLVELSPVLIATFATLVGFVIAAQALAFVLISPELRILLAMTPEGLKGIARPYHVVAAASTAAFVSSLWLFITQRMTAGPGWFVHLETAAVTFFGAWALGGAVQLVWNSTNLLTWNHTLATTIETLPKRQAS